MHVIFLIKAQMLETGEESSRDDPPGAVKYVLLSVVMIHLLMKLEEGSTHANSDGFGARLVR